MITREDTDRALAVLEQGIGALAHEMVPEAFDRIQVAGLSYIAAGAFRLPLIQIYLGGAILGYQLALAEQQRLAGAAIRGEK